MRPLLFALITLMLTAGVAQGATPDEVDFVITFDANGDWSYEGPPELLPAGDEETGARYTWTVGTNASMLIGELRYPLDAFDIERPEQARPSIDLGDDVYPLFHFFPRPEVWETDGPARVYHSYQEGDEAILRLQIADLGGRPLAGANLTLERDTTPPDHTIGDIERLQPHSFYLETRTDELALADVRLRRAGSDGEWVTNPTPAFHVLQKFPIQGLDAGTVYDVRVVFTDWSANNATAAPFTVETPPPGHGTPPSFEILEPEPGAVLESGSDVTVRVRLLDGDTAVDPSSVRLFVDLEERRDAFTLVDGILEYRFPEPPADGPHTVSVEAQTVDGAKDHVKWNFQVGGGRDAPATGLLVVLGLFALLGVCMRRGHLTVDRA